MPKLPSRTIRIERAAVEKVLALIGPTLRPSSLNVSPRGEKVLVCSACGGALQPNCSPPFVAHQVDCPAVALLLQVAELLKPTGKAKP